MTDTGISLLLAFDSDHPEFVRGFEAGRLWALCQERSDEFTETIHWKNAEMLTRIHEATGRSFYTTPANDDSDSCFDVTFLAVEDGVR